MKTRIAGFELQHPIFNASGPRCTTREELEALGQSDAAAIISKSTTKEAREGNPEPRYADFSHGSINSNGLCNPGYREYGEFLPTLKKFNKPVFCSVSGLCLEDNLQMLRELSEVEGIDAIELNLSCPNIVGKPQMGYDFDQSREVLREAAKVCRKPWGVKLPPYFDFAHFQEMASLLNNSEIKFATCINSMGNGLVIDAEAERVLIKPKGGFGGVGGAVAKPVGLANVRKFRELLKPEISVVGVGGVSTGTDVFEYILAGADAVQVGTALYREGPGIFSRLLSEFSELLGKKGYSSLDDFRNKLKVIE